MIVGKILWTGERPLTDADLNEDAFKLVFYRQSFLRIPRNVSQYDIEHSIELAKRMKSLDFIVVTNDVFTFYDCMDETIPSWTVENGSIFTLHPSNDLAKSMWHHKAAFEKHYNPLRDLRYLWEYAYNLSAATGEYCKPMSKEALEEFLKQLPKSIVVAKPDMLGWPEIDYFQALDNARKDARMRGWTKDDNI